MRKNIFSNLFQYLKRWKKQACTSWMKEDVRNNNKEEKHNSLANK